MDTSSSTMRTSSLADRDEVPMTMKRADRCMFVMAEKHNSEKENYLFCVCI